MTGFKGGKEEAAKMLSLLDSVKSKELIEQIRQKDPDLASQLENSLVKIEDLVHLTPNMKVALLRDIKLETFGLALRTIEQSVTQKILEDLSTGMVLEIEDGLKGKPRKLSDVQLAQEELLGLMKKKIDIGEIVIDSSDEYV